MALRTAVVTGGNRGIGLVTCRALAQADVRVLLTARDLRAAQAAAGELADEGLDVSPEVLDVSDADSVAALGDHLDSRGDTVDILINNAGILRPDDGELLTTPTAVITANIDVHFLGPLHTCQRFVPGMVERGYGRVINVVSGWGSVTDGIPGPAGYALGKAACRALTIRLAAETRRAGDVKVNALDPGWVATRMGGAGATRSPADAARDIVALALTDRRGPTGGLFYDGHPQPW